MSRRASVVLAIVCLSVTALTLLPRVASAVVQQITGSIAANTTWGLPGSGSTVEADVFWVRNPISVNGGFTLTMRQGIVVKFDPGTYLSVAGALQATGTGAQNVIMTSIRDDNFGGDTNGDGGSSLPNPSDWQSIYVGSMAPDSTRLAFTQIRFAGYGNHGAVTFTSVSGRLTNCNIQRSYFGIDCIGNAAPLLVDTNIQASTMTPVVLDFTSTPNISGLILSSANNGYDAFGLRGGTLASNATLPKRGATVGVTNYPNITYVLMSGLTINPGVTLTVNPGVVIKPLGTGITVGGTLTMNGTVGERITLTSINDDNYGQPLDTNNNGSITAPQRGDWSQVLYNQGSTGSVSYCNLKFGTNSAANGMLETVNMTLPVSNTLLSDAGHGICINGPVNPVLNTVAINNCTSTPVLMSISANPTFTNVTFLANTLTALGIIGEAVGVDSHLIQRTVAGYTNITYLLLNNYLTMNSPATLTIDPGVVVKFYGGSTGFTINGALNATGTAPNPVIFTSYRDDLYGNPPDTNGDGSITTPNYFDWGYILFNDTSNDATCKLIYDRITYGSYYCCGPAAQVWTINASPTINNCTISKENYGIRCDGNSAPIITNNTITNCAAAAIIMSVQSDPTITGNTFQTNAIMGLALLSETMSQNATLKYRPTVTFPAPNQTQVFAYVPTGPITIPAGVTLSIQPQVVIKPSSGFTVFDVYGALNAVGGTGTNRIVFTSFNDDAWGYDTNADGSSSTPAAGNWYNLQFQDVATDAQCLMRNCLFQFGSTSVNGVITTVSASPKLARLEFFQNGTALTCNGNSAPSCDSLFITNCTYLPIVMSLISNPSFANMTFSNNQWTALGLLGETIGQDVTTAVRNLGPGILSNMVYIPTGTITIAFGAKWTINPGVVIKMGRIYSENFGAFIQIDGALVANGTAGNRITFTSTADDVFGGDTHGDGALTQPTQGNWYHVYFTPVSNAAATVINYCRFLYAGFSGPALRFNSIGPTVSNSVIYNSYDGVQIEGAAAPTFTNVNIDSCTHAPVRMSLVSNPTFNNVQFLGNAFTALAVVNETIAQDLLWKIRPVAGRLNMPYMIDGTLGVGLGSTVTMQPGVMVKFTSGGIIDVNRAFIAEGRTLPESSIVFTSIRDDFYGGRTDANPTNVAPVPGDWNYISIQGTAIDPQVRFRNCVFRYGGYSNAYGAIRCINSAPSVDSTIFAYNQVGISAEGASNPVIHGSSLYANTYYAVNNPGNAFCLNATGNYWGAANGPNDASAVADLCGTNVNAGSGDIVSQNVNYSGFTTAGLQNALLGDVSLNGVVRAFDASLVLQYLASLITLNPLQKLVANVNYPTAGIDNLDASLILQYVAGVIPALPGNQTGAHEVSPGMMVARRIVDQARGVFTLTAGTPRRVGSTWELPILASGTAPIYGAELELSGANATALASMSVAGDAIYANGTLDGTARIALAAGHAIAEGEIATLRFPAGDGTWDAPRVTWARVNSEIVTDTRPTPGPPTPSLAYLAPPAPNPAGGPVSLSFGISAKEDGARAIVRVHDLAGRLVRTVHDGALTAGVHTFTWDLHDASGGVAAPGVYLVRAQSGAFQSVRRLIVIR